MGIALADLRACDIQPQQLPVQVPYNLLRRFKKTLPLGSLLAIGLFACSIQASRSQPYTFGTWLGSPTNPGSSDGTNATAQFTAPTGLALDKNSNLFLLDGNSIRQITTSGGNRVVRTLVGSILFHGFADGTNSVALFNVPQGIAVDAAGNLYVADTGNNAIRKVTPTGTNWVVTTIAGPAPVFHPPFGVSDGTNNTARFHNPYGVAVDSTTNLYVADSQNHTIRKIAPVGPDWVVTTVAGLATVSGSANGSNAVARFNFPTDLAADTSGILYVADFTNNTIRKITPLGTNWAVTTLAGSAGVTGAADGVGAAALFNQPHYIAIDSAQNLFVTDYGSSTIRKITPAGRVSTLAGSPGIMASVDGTGSAALFNYPYGIAVDASGAVFVAEYLGYSIRWGELAPLLQDAHSGQQLVLFWPAGLAGFVPEFSPGLPAAVWTPLPTNGIVLADEYFFLTNSPGSGPRFYRLHKQGP
jgi:streptogramin lyase